ncbi:DUF6907 domain-containing protein [Streptomyces sp. NPDC050416]|uniref:DUF6907 domain-containing protein n=1 Tax=Streptomyces sp. NPDC050416 TaxID=3365611 RepID=UPI0037897B8F
MTIIDAGRIASAPVDLGCPEWCVIDHSEDPWIGTEDFFHRGDEVNVPAPPGARPQYAEPLLSTHLVDHCNNPEWSCIAIGTGDRGFDLETVEQADAYIAHLKSYTAAVEEMRDRLAAIKEQQS